MRDGEQRNGSGRRPRRSWRWRALLLALVALPAAGCSSPSPGPDRREDASAPEQSFRNLELTETTEGRLDWILHSRRAFRRGSTEATRLESLRVEFYQGTDSVRSVLTADSGRVDSRHGTFVAKGNVVVVNPQGNRLETEELFWDRKSSKVASERFVRLVREDDVLTGVGFESDPNLERYRIEREVRASVREGGALRDELRDADTTGTAR